MTAAVRERPFVMRYGIACAALAVALLVRASVDRLLGEQYLFSFLYPAVALAVWFGGVGPAVSVIVAGFLASVWLFVPSRFALQIESPANYVGAVIFIVGACTILVFGELARRYLRRAADSERRKDQALRALAESEKLYRAAGELIPFGMWTADERGHPTYLSKSFLEMLGDAFIGQLNRWTERIHPDDFGPIVEAWAEVIASDRDRWEHEFRVRDRDGVYRTVMARGVALRDERTGRIASWVGVNFDITAVKQAQHDLADALQRSDQTLALLDALLANAPVGFAYFDREHRYVRINEHLAQLNGLSVDAHLGRRIADVLPVNARAVDPILDSVFATGEPVAGLEVTGETPREPGETRHWLTAFYPVRTADGETPYVGAAVMEVTERKRAEDALRRRERELELVTDAMPALISYVDVDMCYRFNNRGYEKWFGIRRDQLVGQHMRDVLGDAAFERVRPHAEAALRGERVDYEAELPYREGGARHVMASYVPDVRPDGRVAGYFALVSDISDRKRAERALAESESVFRTLGEAVPDFLWMSDANGRPIYQNPAWTQYTGLTHADLVEHGWEAMVHPEDLDQAKQAWREGARAGTPLELEFRCRRRDGAYRWFLSRTVPLRDETGRVTKWVGTITDIHDRREMEQTLREADRRKDDFLAMLGHELRNPLAPIRNAVQVLGSDSAHEREWARDVIERQVKHLTRLVDDLLDVSRITRGKITLRAAQVDLAHVARQAVETARPLAEQRGQTLDVSLPETDVPLIVNGDEARLAQVVQNLLHNATKFTPEGGHVRLSLESQDGEAIVRVCDDGCGIAPEMLARVFEPFAQADRSLDRSFGGLGIGLTLVKTLVELHGGRVDGHSDGPGRGSEFRVHLPLVRIAPISTDGDDPTPTAQPWASNAQPDASHVRVATAHAPADQTAAPARGLRVLVVDDNYDSARSMSLLLKLWGHKSEVAQDGHAALDCAATFHPDVVLLDIGLPGISGYDVARELRRRAASRGALLVAMTGYGQSEDRQRSAESGFDHHLVKPVDPSAVERLLRTARSSVGEGADADAVAGAGAGAPATSPRDPHAASANGEESAATHAG